MKINSCHFFKRNFAENSVFTLNKDHFDKHRLGALPYDWIKNTNRQDIPSMTQNVDKAFQEYAMKVSTITEKDVFELNNKALKENLSQILKRDDVDVSFINRSFHKNCQKISVGDYDYAFLTFRYFDDAYAGVYGHGTTLEPCNIFYMYKNYSKGRVVKPFITRYSDDGSRNAYMLVKFIDKNDTSRMKKDTPLFGKSSLFKFDGMGTDNFINGITIDIGGVSKFDKRLPKDLHHLLNKVLNYITKVYYVGGKRFNGSKKSDEIFDIVRASQNADKLICKSLNDGVDIYNQDNRELISSLNKYERKFFLKKVRALKKYHKLKVKLQQEGKYNDYKEYVNKRYQHTPRGAKSILVEVNKQD